MNSLASRRTLLRLYPALKNKHSRSALTLSPARGHESRILSFKHSRNSFLATRAAESFAPMNSTAEGASLNDAEAVRGTTKSQTHHYGLERLFDGYEKSIRPTLDAVDKIRSYVKDLPEIEALLPAIVVVGEQSSGKSSLLESISGIDLPRGTGMCTKVPLELQLRKSEAKESISMEYTNSHGVKVHRKNIAFREISKEIENATNNIVGNTKTIKDSPISVRICGPTMQDLTLIDLPGVTRASNTPEMANVEAETKSMIKKYVKAKSKVIVCALPANADFSNSGALKIAQEVDREGKRTLGVVTKIDTYERGTRIKDKIEGTHETEIRLKQGYVAVRCRTQEELGAGMSLEDLHAAEHNLLNSDEELKQIPDELKGTPNLINRLIQVQRNRLKEGVPDLVSKVAVLCFKFVFTDACQIEKAVSEHSSELELLESFPETTEDFFSRLIMEVHSLCASHKEIISRQLYQEGRFDLRHEIYTSLEVYKKQITKTSSNTFNDRLYKKVEELCSKEESVALPNFLSISAFNRMYKTEFLDKYIEPTSTLIDEVYSKTLSALHGIIEESLQGHLKEIIPLFKNMIDEYYNNVKTEVSANIMEDIAMNVESFAPLTSCYETNLRRIQEYQAGFEKHINSYPVYALKNLSSFDYPEEKLLRCNEEEMLWMQNKIRRPGAEVTKNQCLQMMNSISTYSRCVCDCLLEYIPKKIFWKFVTKPCGKGSDSLLAFMLKECNENKEDFFHSIQDPELIIKRDKLKKQVKELEMCKDALKQIDRAFH